MRLKAGYLFPFALPPVLVTGIFLAATAAQAVQYDFYSRYDHFNVDFSNGRATFDGKPVTGRPFQFIQPLFEAELEDPCDRSTLPKQPDLTIIRRADKSNAQPFAMKRLVYFSKHLISDGTHCDSVSGQGLYLLPLHHKWFTATNETLSIDLESEFSIEKNRQQLIAFRKDESGWHCQTKNFNPNWILFRQFKAALTDFRVDFRAAPQAGDLKSSFTLKTGGRNYLFEKVGKTTWAVRLPGSPWLVASGQFGAFGEMDASKWVSPYDKNLRVIQDSKADIPTRIKALNSLSADALASVRPMLAEILNQPGEPSELRDQIVSLLRSTPSDQNMRILVQALHASDDPQFLNVLTRALLVRNPRGPVIQVDDTTTAITAKINKWQRWQASLRQSAQ